MDAVGGALQNRPRERVFVTVSWSEMSGDNAVEVDLWTSLQRVRIVRSEPISWADGVRPAQLILCRSLSPPFLRIRRLGCYGTRSRRRPRTLDWSLGLRCRSASSAAGEREEPVNSEPGALLRGPWGHMLTLRHSSNLGTCRLDVSEYLTFAPQRIPS
jgi:hypothetical protein